MVGHTRVLVARIYAAAWFNFGHWVARAARAPSGTDVMNFRSVTEWKLHVIDVVIGMTNVN